MRRPPNAPAFLHLFADCPCCSGQMSVVFRSLGHLSVIEAKHRDTEKVAAQ